MTDSKILRVGIVGCGDIFNSHIQAYPDHPNAVIVGFYDRIRARSEHYLSIIRNYMNLVKEASQESDEAEDKIHLSRCQIFDTEAKVYDSVDDLLKNVDVIDVCTPNYAHAPYAIWALKRDKSVMTEKPPARCSLETQRIIDAAKSSKGFYQINENMFFQVFVREIKKLIDSGKIGGIKKITSKLGHGGPSWGWNNHFLNPSLSGGGAMCDMGVHAIGQAFGVIGPDYKVTKVQTISMKCGAKSERQMKDSDGANEYSLHKFMVEDDATVQAWMKNEKTNNEIILTIQTSWAQSLDDLRIEGSVGTITLERDEKKNRIIVLTKNNVREVLQIPVQGRDSHVLECVDFLNRIAKGERAYVDEYWSHQMELIITGAYMSHMLAQESKQKKGVEVTPADLDRFYKKLIDSGIPESMLYEDIVYRLLAPFTAGYFTPGEKFQKESTPAKLK